MSSGAFVLGNVAVNLTPLLVSDPCILVSPGLFSWATQALLEKLSTRSPASERYELGASLFKGWSSPMCTMVLHVTCSFHPALLTPWSHSAPLSCNPFAVADKTNVDCRDAGQADLVSA